MSLSFFILFTCLLAYTLLLLWMALGFMRTSFFTPGERSPQLPLTIIVCARNEEKNIARCLNALLKQDYPRNKLQLILINDASTDQTVQRAESILKSSGLEYKIISNQQQKGKKQSISYAMQFAAHELIVLRDADTFTRSEKWLQSISGFYQDAPSDLIIGPLAIADSFGLFWALQAIETNVLSVATCGSTYYKKPFLSNGANLIFTKQIFEKVNGYASHLHIPSGDDIFFMEDVKKIPGSSIRYLKSKDAIVYTYPCFSFKQLIQQKIRWASKFKLNKNKLNLTLSILTFLVNLGWLFCFFCINLSPYKNVCLLFILFKLFIDILLLFLASGFIKNKNSLWFSLPVGCIYPIYACIIGIASLLVKPKWK